MAEKIIGENTLRDLYTLEVLLEFSRAVARIRGQHPGGDYKKISLQNNFVEYVDKHVVQYTTSTEPGSSG